MATIVCKRCNQKCCTCEGCKIVGEYCKTCFNILEEEKANPKKEEDVTNKSQ